MAIERHMIPGKRWLQPMPRYFTSNHLPIIQATAGVFTLCTIWQTNEYFSWLQTTSDERYVQKSLLHLVKSSCAPLKVYKTRMKCAALWLNTRNFSSYSEMMAFTHGYRKKINYNYSEIFKIPQLLWYSLTNHQKCIFFVRHTQYRLQATYSKCNLTTAATTAADLATETMHPTEKGCIENTQP
jgi:hypothetical protein